MEIVIKGEAKEIAALVLAVQEQQKVIKSPNDNRESMIKALENRLSKLRCPSLHNPLEIL